MCIYGATGLRGPILVYMMNNGIAFNLVTDLSEKQQERYSLVLKQFMVSMHNYFEHAINMH